MIQTVYQQSGRFILLILFQVLILNNIQLGGYINPYLYVLFILLLPMELPGWLGLLLAFVLGFSIDIFTSTIGMHVAACLFMAWCRPMVIQLLAPRDGYDFGMQPTIKGMGFTWFASYAGILVILHHLFLFYTEIFRFSEFFHTLTRVLLSTTFTVALIIISQFLVYRNKK